MFKPGTRDFISSGHVLSYCKWDMFSRKSADTVNGCVFAELPVRKMATTEKTNKKCVTIENMNENIIRLEYAVRGPIVIRAGEIEKELEQVFLLVFY